MSALPALGASILAALGIAACGGSSSSRSTGSSSSSVRSGSSTASAAAASPTTTRSASTLTPATGSGAPVGSAGAGSTCRSSQLRLSFVSGQGAAGTAYLTFSLTNAAARTCTMIGYPGFAMLDAQGAIVQHPARRGIPTPTPVKLLSLGSGRRARFTVTSSDVIPSPGCRHAYSGAAVQVYPPNQLTALRLPHPLQFCNLHVGAVQPAG
ncbi:MAG: DUF4232 domain-containing protein [Solirubrobacteraceae bacterium]